MKSATHTHTPPDLPGRVLFDAAGVRLICGDALRILPALAAGSVAAVITDPPYGTTSLAWDKDPAISWLALVLPSVRADGALVSFAGGRFTIDLAAAHRKLFRYRMIWERGGQATGYLDANRRPLREFEDVLVFGRRQPRYFAQKVSGTPYSRTGSNWSRCYGKERNRKQAGERSDRHPTDILRFAKPVNRNRPHPTQKPIDLLRWLVRSYSEPGDLIVDPFGGSGTTAAACLLEGRRCLSIERDRTYAAGAALRLAAIADELAPQWRAA